ncbi:tetratricopeptide repeat protein [Gryllotalpicola reticulitermitis]|uniref:Tetratricopeptide repeat protein n=1 Tax=Gryllotalpicola reticulitermitis TaxID=1184153 RepID=A0ABV8QCW2_9MICO
MAFVNYYDVLQINRTAEQAEIEKAISAKEREWRPRANHPKLETRQLAEQHIKYVAEAGKILLDRSQRAEYDKQLAAQQAAPAPSVDPGGRDWLQIAIEYIQAGNASNGNYAAREATTQQPENPEAWYWRGVSSEALGNNRDAEFELNEAVRLNPNQAYYHGELGDLYRTNELWSKAVDAYQRARDLDPNRAYYQAALGASVVATGDTSKGLELLKEAHDREPDNQGTNYWYGLALEQSIQDSWSHTHKDQQGDFQVVITNESQLEYSKKQLAVIKRLKIDDRDFANDLDEMEIQIEKAEQVKFWSTQGIGGLIFGEVATFIAMIIAFSAGHAGIFFGIVFLGLMVLWILLWVRSRRMPGWKWNWKQAAPYIRNTGLQ